MRRLFEGGVYSRAAFIRGNTVFIVFGKAFDTIEMDLCTIQLNRGYLTNHFKVSRGI